MRYQLNTVRQIFQLALIIAFGGAILTVSPVFGDRPALIAPINSPLVMQSMTASQPQFVWGPEVVPAECIVNSASEWESKVNGSSCAIVEIANGDHQGAFQVRRAVRIHGASKDGVILRGLASGANPVLNILASNVSLQTLTIDGMNAVTQDIRV